MSTTVRTEGTSYNNYSIKIATIFIRLVILTVVFNTVACLRFYQILLGWVGKRLDVTNETDELPTTQRPTRPLKTQEVKKWHFGPLFPTASDFSWGGIDFI